MITKDTSTIDRKQASRILGVSVRTIDRYIRSGKLPAYSRSGRILLKKSDIQHYSTSAPVEQIRPMMTRAPQNVTRQALSVPVHVSTSARRAPLSGRNNNAPSEASRHGDDFYKDLYDEAKKILTEYHQKLEQANYRIGQLESQVTNGSPMNALNAGFTRSAISMRDSDSVAHELLKKDLSDKEKEITQLKNTIAQEQSARTIFAVLTYLLLATIPVMWYLMHS